MDRDGSKAGFDCELTACVSGALRIPVIASGGAGGAEHFAQVFREGRADAALAASVFHYGLDSIGHLKRLLAATGHPDEAAMLIPAIDLMGGKVVQLVGRRAALAFDDVDACIDRFRTFPLVHVSTSMRRCGGEQHRSRDPHRAAAAHSGRRRNRFGGGRGSHARR